MRRRKKADVGCRIQAIDLFSGVGGSTSGAKAAGIRVVAAIDAWKLACDSYTDNHPETTVYNSRCEDIDPRNIRRRFGPIDMILASPECTSHTCAKGAAERSESSRATAFQVMRFAEVLRPRWIVIENVIHIRTWSRYSELLGDLSSMGYCCSPQILNSSHFGVPQARKRLFIICSLNSECPKIVAPAGTEPLPARHVIDSNGTYRYSPLRSEKRAAATIERAERAMAKLGMLKSFLLVYYGMDGAGGWQKIDMPLRTITTLDRFAFVRPSQRGHEMRMLQVPELKLGMGFSNDYVLKRGTRRDKIKLLGNAVCPPVMSGVIRALKGSEPEVKPPMAKVVAGT